MSANSTPDLQDTGLVKLTADLRNAFDIQDRTYGLSRTTYKRCFIGTEGVAKMVEKGLAKNADDALSIGNLLIDAGLMRHVLGEHHFKNEHLFYRFVEDEDHGSTAKNPTGKTISWGDLLPPLQKDNENSLQPKLPEPDTRLGEFHQISLTDIEIQPLDEHNVRLLDNTHPKVWIDPTPKERYNLVVIGAGAGGLVTSAGAAGVGAEVALIEEHLMGGDCLNVGCVPSKALLKSAKVAQMIRKAATYGVHVEGEVRVNFSEVMERMRRLRADISPVDSTTRYANTLGVDVYMGRAQFTGPDTVTVNGKTLRFAKAVIATGGTAAIPDIPGLDNIPYLTNASVFNLTELPKRLGVLGAGPIGIEIAQAFKAFGAEVTVLNRGKEILEKEDREAAQIVREALEREGVHFVLGNAPELFRHGGAASPVIVTLQDKRELKFDALLIATGRKPSVAGLGLEAAGVSFNPRVGVTVDERLQTTNNNIYAVGDVASRYQFTHAADFMARIAIRNALFFGRASAAKMLIPWATYTDPEIAHVGLYPRDLDERNIPFDTYTREFSDVDRTILDGENRGFVKIHVKKDTDNIVGATIVGAHAGDMISELTLAIQNNVGLGTIANVIHPYPTAAEAIRQCGDAYNRTRLSPTINTVFNRFLRFQRR